MEKTEESLLEITQEIIHDSLLNIATKMFAVYKRAGNKSIDEVVEDVTKFTDEELTVMFISTATEKLCTDVLKTRSILRLLSLGEVNLLNIDDIHKIYQALLKITTEIMRAGVSEMLTLMDKEYEQANKEAKEKEDVKNTTKRRNH